jgi:hypothetical protein
MVAACREILIHRNRFLEAAGESFRNRYFREPA